MDKKSGGARSATTLVLAVAATQLLFGAHYALAKQVLIHVPPLAWAGLRATAATVCLVTLAVVAGHRILPRRGEWARYGALALFGVTLSQVLFVAGLSRTTTGHTALLNATMPVMIAIVSACLAGERLSVQLGVSLALNTVGVFVLLRADGFALQRENLAGDALVLASVFTNAIAFVMVRRLSPQVSPLALTARMFACGSVVLLALAAPSMANMNWAAVPGSAWGYAVAVIVGPTVIGYTINAYILRHMTASKAGLFKHVEVLVAAFIAGAVLGEKITWRFWTAALFIMGGITITALKRR